MGSFIPLEERFWPWKCPLQAQWLGASHKKVKNARLCQWRRASTESMLAEKVE